MSESVSQIKGYRAAASQLKRYNNNVDLWHSSTLRVENKSMFTFMPHIAANTWFGHFSGKNPDTGQKKIFLNSDLKTFPEGGEELGLKLNSPIWDWKLLLSLAEMGVNFHPSGPLFGQAPLKSVSQVPFRSPTEGPWRSLGSYDSTGISKKCYQSLKGPRKCIT